MRVLANDDNAEARADLPASRYDGRNGRGERGRHNSKPVWQAGGFFGFRLGGHRHIAKPQYGVDRDAQLGAQLGAARDRNRLDGDAAPETDLALALDKMGVLSGDGDGESLPRLAGIGDDGGEPRRL